jgi:hypothetical protein
MEMHPTADTAQGPTEERQVGYAVDRFGSATSADVLDSLLRDVDLDAVAEAIEAYGLQTVAEQYLRALIERGALHADEAAAYAEEDRILAEDPHTSPVVHPVTVAELADEFTRLDLTARTASCR